MEARLCFKRSRCNLAAMAKVARVFPKFWDELPKSIQDRFEAAASLKSHKRGDMIFNAGDANAGIYVCLSGLVAIGLIGSKGNEHLLRFCRKGQIFGHRSLFLSECRQASAHVLEDAEVVLIPKAEILSLCEDWPKFYILLIQSLSKELRRAESQQVLILDNQILPRVAKSLVHLKSVYPEHNWTRQEIANFCASTSSTVIKALAELEKRNLIEQDGREIRILNSEALISLEDEGAKND